LSKNVKSIPKHVGSGPQDGADLHLQTTAHATRP